MPWCGSGLICVVNCSCRSLACHGIAVSGTACSPLYAPRRAATASLYEWSVMLGTGSTGNASTTETSHPVTGLGGEIDGLGGPNILVLLSLSTHIQAAAACCALGGLHGDWVFGRHSVGCTLAIRIACSARLVAGSRRTWPEKVLRALPPRRLILVVHGCSVEPRAAHPGASFFIVHAMVGTESGNDTTGRVGNYQDARVLGCDRSLIGIDGTAICPREVEDALNFWPGSRLGSVDVTINRRNCHHRTTDADDDRHLADPDLDHDGQRSNGGGSDLVGRGAPLSSLPSSPFPPPPPPPLSSHVPPFV